MFKLLMLIIWMFVMFYLVYYVAISERHMDIMDKRRKNRIAFKKYVSNMEIKNYMKSRYDIDYEEESV